MFKIKTERLVVVAGVVWAIAGLNIFKLGIDAYTSTEWQLLVFVALLAGTVAVFTMFHLKVFNKMVGKHVHRIRSYPDAKTNVFKFFDIKGYLIMAIMMGGGISLRMSGLVPGWFIAFFYTGIGFALLIAGVSFLGRHFTQRGKLGCPFVFRSWAKNDAVK